MTTGKIEFAPDYKSDFEIALRQGRSVSEAMLTANDRAAERSRLEREVIEKARQWNGCIAQDADAFVFAENELRSAINSLMRFESSQQQIQK